MIKDQSLEAFLDALASQASTPGGGSAAAVSGAMGAALVSMVCNLTIGKKKYAAVEDDLKVLLARASDLRSQLIELISADAEAFDRVMAAYGLPRESEADRRARDGAIQAALKEATLVPLACAQACAEVIALGQPVLDKGNPNVASDTGVAVLSAYAGLRSAALNVYINLGSITDETFAAETRATLDNCLAGMGALTEAFYAQIRSKL